jgi:hypothetical protein
MALYAPVTERRTFDGGLPFYEVFLTNWGNAGALADPQSLQYPAGPSDAALAFPDLVKTYAGAAIGPLSTAVNAVICYSLFQDHDPADYPADITSTARVLISPEFPLFSGLPGRLAIQHPVAFASVVPIGSVGPPPVSYTFTPTLRDQTAFKDTYVQKGATATSPFGTALTAARFEAPLLHLYLYTNQLPPAPPKRAPMFRNLAPSYSVANGTEQLLFVFPVMGRKRIRVSLRTTNTGSHDVRVTMVSQNPFSGSSQPDSIEEQFGAATLASQADIANVHISDPQHAWLLVYGKRAQGTASVNIFLQAED